MLKKCAGFNPVTPPTLVQCITTQPLSAAERRGTPVLLSASVSDNSGNSPQMSARGGRVK